MAAAADTPPLEWHADAGGQFDADSHGAVDLGVRRGAWSLLLETDTLEARLDASGERGRAWGAVRGELGAAGLMISPWRDGAPDPTRALTASYLGAEGGVLAYGPGGTCAGGTFLIRTYGFGALADTTIDVPGPREIVEMTGVAGVYRGPGHAWVQGGMWGPDPAPSLTLEAVWRPETTLAPVGELRAGWSHGLDDVTRTRLGGLNPYVVPLAGAAWGEWWVDTYAAARVGARLHLTAGAWSIQPAAVVDLATFTAVTLPGSGEAVGFAGMVELHRGRFFGEGALGVAPWIPRGEGVSRASVWMRIGVDWGRGARAHESG